VDKRAGIANLAKTILMYVVGITVLMSVAGNIYIKLHYAAVMPSHPDPQTGKIYRVPSRNGGFIYVNEKELAVRDFFRIDMMTLSGIGMLIALWGYRRGWMVNISKHR